MKKRIEGKMMGGQRMKGERTEWQRTEEERVARTKTHSRRKMIGQMRSGTSFRNVNVELRKKMAVQMQLYLGHVHFDECVLSGIRVRFDVFWTGRHRYPQKT